MDLRMLGGKLVLHERGFVELRTSPRMDDVVLRAARLAAARATGQGIECNAELSPGRNRARAVVVPATAEDALETARHPEVMIGALEAARNVV